jgi:hypothetical protein
MGWRAAEFNYSRVEQHIRVRAHAFYMHASSLAFFPRDVHACMHAYAYALMQWPTNSTIYIYV